MSGRVEIITGPERRRRWSEEEKLQLVEEACRPGHSVSQVARQRGINASQLFAWRRQAVAKGLVSAVRSEPTAVPALAFAPVKVAEEAREDGKEQMSLPRGGSIPGGSASIEIELRSGDRVLVEGCADAGLVLRIVSALRRA